jgi:hypothetical protein
MVLDLSDSTFTDRLLPPLIGRPCGNGSTHAHAFLITASAPLLIVPLCGAGTKNTDAIPCWPEERCG